MVGRPSSISAPTENDAIIKNSDADGDISRKHVAIWSPSGKWYKDFLFFVGPGWFVSIAYIDPGNYQADIQAGAT